MLPTGTRSSFNVTKSKFMKHVRLLNKPKMKSYRINPQRVRRWSAIILTIVFSLFLAETYAQERRVSGVVSDENGNGIPGANVVIKGTSTGTITDIDGRYSINVSGDAVLVFSFVGYVSQEVPVGVRSQLDVSLASDVKQLEEIVIVGFGEQKKASVVGAITQTTGKVLERAGGVSSVGAALTGNLPGVVTMSSTGMPGEEDPRILIRGRSSWNSSEPLILIDGIERPISSVDINSVDRISVLKDASATAVFGVRGANGVILITTKRGQEGRADININASSTMKLVSKLPARYDSYDALRIRNEVIESELGVKPEAWVSMTPQAILDKYRYPASLAESERYPNVDWEDALLKDYAMAYNANFNISGGTSHVKYFANLDFQHEGDLFQEFDNNRGYHAGYGYNRLNVRSNLDFLLTPTTTLRAGLSGSHGVKKGPNDMSYEYMVWAGLYTIAPDGFLPRYSDGVWGYFYPSPSQATQNSMETLAIKGVGYTNSDRINTDFTLEQDLGKVLKGLRARALLSFDNEFREAGRGINDIYNSTLHKWIDPETGIAYYDQTVDNNNKFDFQEGVRWGITSGSMQAGLRRLYYSGQINYANSFAEKHNVTAMGDFSREENATGSMLPRFRENWVYRVTYDFDSRYFLEYNGAYNGSEKFSDENRFGFFQSGALGWMVTEEPFIKSLNLKWLDMMKIRASFGEIGDDYVTGRWLYLTSWEYLYDNLPSGQNIFRQGLTGVNGINSPYPWYREESLGNPNVHWEVVTKKNLGIDLDIFDGLLSGTFEFFNDKRTDILIEGGSRAVPSYFGSTAPVANLGRVNTKGYEMELRLNKQFSRGFRLWGNFNFTHAEDKILSKDDPELKPEYQKEAGKPNDQPYAYVSHGYYNNYDELYGSTAHDGLDDARMPGNYIILDYDADGMISEFDNVPFGFPGTPQNTFSSMLGFDYKGWGGFVQFYGVNNVTRQVVFSSLGGTRNTVFEEGSYWSKDNQDGDVPLPRWNTIPSNYTPGTRYMYDGSYIRLKNVELSYTFSQQRWAQSLGVENMKLYVNGNNLWLWTKMPDDRESNFAGTGWASQGAYPTVKRVNVGLRITL